MERCLVSCADTCSQDAGAARVGYLYVVVARRQTCRTRMRRAAIQVNVVFISVDVEIDATTGGVGGEDRAGKRRIGEVCIGWFVRPLLRSLGEIFRLGLVLPSFTVLLAKLRSEVLNKISCGGVCSF